MTVTRLAAGERLGARVEPQQGVVVGDGHPPARDRAAAARRSRPTWRASGRRATSSPSPGRSTPAPTRSSATSSPSACSGCRGSSPAWSSGSPTSSSRSATRCATCSRDACPPAAVRAAWAPGHAGFDADLWLQLGVDGRAGHRSHRRARAASGSPRSTSCCCSRRPAGSRCRARSSSTPRSACRCWRRRAPRRWVRRSVAASRSRSPTTRRASGGARSPMSSLVGDGRRRARRRRARVDAARVGRPVAARRGGAGRDGAGARRAGRRRRPRNRPSRARLVGPAVRPRGADDRDDRRVHDARAASSVCRSGATRRSSTISPTRCCCSSTPGRRSTAPHGRARSVQPTRGRDVSMAKVMADRAAARAARAALQCHGAIGYTWEHDLHLWMKRVWVLERRGARPPPTAPACRGCGRRSARDRRRSATRGRSRLERLGHPQGVAHRARGWGRRRRRRRR